MIKHYTSKYGKKNNRQLKWGEKKKNLIQQMVLFEVTWPVVTDLL